MSENAIVTEIETLVEQFAPNLAAYVAAKAISGVDTAAVSSATSDIIKGLLALEVALTTTKATSA